MGSSLPFQHTELYKLQQTALTALVSVANHSSSIASGNQAKDPTAPQPALANHAAAAAAAQRSTEGADGEEVADETESASTHSSPRGRSRKRTSSG